MESLVLSLISKYLKEYVNNFRKEQVSIDFLRGQGVMRDLDINVDAINDLIFQSSAPSLKFNRILINTLSIDAPMMSLKSKPIVVFIDEIFIELSEVVEIMKKPQNDDNNNTKDNKKPSAKYGYFDRIIDCMSLELNKIYIGFRTLGRNKTDKIGPWTPPVILVELCGNRFFCTNNNGVEVELDECLRVRPTKRPVLFLYKTFNVKRFNCWLINPELWFSVADELIAGNGMESVSNNSHSKFPHGTRGYCFYKMIDNLPLQYLVCMRKRLDNNFLLGFELTIVMDEVKVSIRQQILAEFLHACVGISYCLFREDVVEEIYGPDPHNEHNAPTPTRSRQLARDELDTEERKTLDMLEAEGKVIGTTITDEREDWQRSSLNSDEDPPHMRYVIALQINECTVMVNLDDLKSPTANGTNDQGNKQPQGKLLKGVSIKVYGFVHTLLWPEHAAITESVLQTTFHYLNISDFEGVQKTCLLRTKKQFDNATGMPMFIDLLPRGVKEQSHADPETVPGLSFMYKKDCNWPPPPIGKGIAINTEICICPLEITLKIGAFSDIISCISGAWDPRWVNGKYDDLVIERVHHPSHSPGSRQTVLVISGMDITYFPALDASNSSIPSQFALAIGLISLIWKSTLDLNFMHSMLAPENNFSKDEIDEETIYEEFPHRKEDLSYGLKRSKPIPGVNLLSSRFEAALSEISVSIVMNKFQNAFREGHDYFEDAPKAPRRVLIKPFSVVYFDSIDPAPVVDSSLTTLDRYATPYNRVYYWTPDSGDVIGTKFLGIDDFVAELSLLDIVQVMEVYKVLQSEVKSCNAYAWFMINLNPNPEDDIETPTFSSPRKSVDSNDDFINDDEEDIRDVCRLHIIRVRNFQLYVISDQKTKTTESFMKTSGEEGDKAPTDQAIESIIHLAMKQLYVVREKPSRIFSQNDTVLVVKGVCNSITVTIFGKPFLYFTCDSLPPSAIIACANGSDPFKYLSSQAVAAFRYEVKRRDEIRHSSFCGMPSTDSASKVPINRVTSSEFIQTSSATVDIKFYPEAKLMFAPKQIDALASNLVHEVLQGFGTITRQPKIWWEDSVAGYFRSFFDDLVGGDSRLGIIVPITKRRIARMSGREEPVLFKVLSNALEFIIIDTSPKFSALTIRASKVSWNGRIRSGDTNDPMLKMITSMSIEIFLRYEDDNNQLLTEQVCENFNFKSDLSKAGVDPLSIESNVSFNELKSTVTSSSSTIAKKLFMDITLSLNHTQKLIFLFWNTVESSVIPISDGEEINAVKRAFEYMNSELLQLNSTNDSEFDVNSDIPSLKASEYSEAGGVLANNLSHAILNSYMQVKNVERLLTTSSQDVSISLSGIRSVCNELVDVIDTVKRCAIVTSSQMPRHCGWIRRSSGFSKPDKTMGTSRCWATLIDSSVYFMMHPYSKIVDVEISLEFMVAIDPDENSQAAEKDSLSTHIWIVDDEGLLIIDAISLDEKLMWLEALNTWLVPLKTLESSPIHQQLLNKKNEDFNFPIIKLKTNNEKTSTTKRLKSATKGMFKALREGSKSIVSPLAGLASGITSNNNNDKKDNDNRKSQAVSQWPPQIGAVDKPIEKRGSKIVDQIDIYEYDVHKTQQDYGPLSNLLQQLDHMKETLSYFHSIFDEASTNADETFTNSLQLLAKSHRTIGKVVMGLATMRMLQYEAFDHQKDIELRCSKSMTILSTELRKEKDLTDQLQQRLGKSKEKQEEIESVLQACTTQHINNIQIITNQYYDLQEKYSIVRKGGDLSNHDALGVATMEVPSSTQKGPGNNFQEIVRHLTISITEMEAMLKAGEEREIMIQEEMDAIVVETDLTRKQNSQLKETLIKQSRSSDAVINGIEEKLNNEIMKRENIERENRTLKSKVAALMNVLKGLGIADVADVVDDHIDYNDHNDDNDDNDDKDDDA